MVRLDSSLEESLFLNSSSSCLIATGLRCSRELTLLGSTLGVHGDAMFSLWYRGGSHKPDILLFVKSSNAAYLGSSKSKTMLGARQWKSGTCWYV